MKEAIRIGAAIIAASVILFGMTGCTDSSEAKRVLENAGFTSVKITGWSPFSCSKDDFFRTGFTAIGPTGRSVSGTVCSGILFKGSTIRF